VDATENVMRLLPIVSTLFSHSAPKQLARKASCWFQRNLCQHRRQHQ
jgi:hypothetical protein